MKDIFEAIGSVDEAPWVDLRHRRVWGRSPGGAGGFPAGFHVEVLPTDERVRRLIIEADADNWQRLSSKRREALRSGGLSLARRINFEAVRKGRFDLWIRRNGAYTREFTDCLKQSGKIIA